MKNRFYKRTLAFVLSVLLIGSMLFTDSSESFAGNISGNDLEWTVGDVSGSDISGSDASGPDVSGSDANGSDISGSDASGSDVSGSDANESDVSNSDISNSDISDSDIGGDVSAPDITVSENIVLADAAVEAAPFVVEDGSGNLFGSYADWTALLNAFKERGNSSEEYAIRVSEEGVIGTTMPSKAGKLVLSAEEDGGVLYFAGSSLNMASELVIGTASLRVSGSEKPVNINTKGKTLTLEGTKNLGNVKGTTAGTLYLKGDVEIQGVLQTFKYVTVDGSLKLGGNMTAITNLNMESGRIYPAAGKSFSVKNVTAGENGTLVYPAEGSLPVVKISGTVTGILSLRQYAEEDGEAVERYFAAGSKLLTASKARAEQFAVYGEKQSCYKKGSVIYVGAEVLQLSAEGELLGTYVQWSDLVAKINSLNRKSAVYNVALLDDFVINGALTMPGKGKYAGLVIKNGGEKASASLNASGNLAMTANLELGESVHLRAAAVSGGSWQLRMGENAELVATGAVTVNRLIMDQGVSLQSGGKFTVKTSLEADMSAELILTQKKGAAIKDTQVKSDGYITVRVRDKNDNYVTLTQGTNVFMVSGSSYATQFRLLDAEGQAVELYRKGNAIKVRGGIETPIALYYVTENGEVCLGEYAALADIKTEITRRRDAKASYRLDVEQELFVKGAIPLPSGGTYQELVISGERIRTTGNLTLTGNLTFQNEIRKVKSAGDDTPLAFAVNVSKYQLTIPEGAAIENLGGVTGNSGSGLRIAADVVQTANGNLKVDTLWLDGTLQVTGNITVTNIYPGTQNRLVYDLGKSFSLKGDVLGDDAGLVLNPQKSGQDVTTYTEGMKIIGSAAKVDVSRLELAWPTDYQFYRDNGVVKLGTPMITVFAGTLDYEGCLGAEAEGQQSFLRINDAIAYINGAGQTDFVVRLDKDVPSAGAFTAPVKGKRVVLCGLEGERKTLKLSGSVTLDGSSLEVRNVKLDNGTAAGIGVVLKNGAFLGLCDTEINTMNAAAGTAVTLEGQVSLKGTWSGACDLTVWKDAVVRSSGSITVKTMTLEKEADEKGSAQFRLLSGKRITVNGTVDSGERGYFTVNQVDKTDALSSLGEGTILVVSRIGEASQFRTENIKPNTLAEWALTKVGDYIKTVTPSEGEGEWSGDYL